MKSCSSTMRRPIAAMNCWVIWRTTDPRLTIIQLRRNFGQTTGAGGGFRCGQRQSHHRDGRRSAACAGGHSRAAGEDRRRLRYRERMAEGGGWTNALTPQAALPDCELDDGRGASGMDLRDFGTTFKGLPGRCFCATLICTANCTASFPHWQASTARAKLRKCRFRIRCVPPADHTMGLAGPFRVPVRHYHHPLPAEVHDAGRCISLGRWASQDRPSAEPCWDGWACEKDIFCGWTLSMYMAPLVVAGAPAPAQRTDDVFHRVDWRIADADVF